MKNSEPKQFIDVKYEEVDDISDSPDTPKRKRKKSRKRIIITLLISLLSVCLVCGLAAGSCYFIYQKELSDIVNLEKQILSLQTDIIPVKEQLDGVEADLVSSEFLLDNALTESLAKDDLEIYAKAYNPYYDDYNIFLSLREDYDDLYIKYQKLLKAYSNAVSNSFFNKGYNSSSIKSFAPSKGHLIVIPHSIIEKIKSLDTDNEVINEFKYNLTTLGVNLFAESKTYNQRIQEYREWAQEATKRAQARREQAEKQE